MRPEANTPSFLLVSNHGQALIAIAENPDVRLREIAERLGITERATQSIVNDLVDAGYVRRTRVGRRNVYTVDSDQPFPHPALRQNTVRSLLDGLVPWTDGDDDPFEELTGQTQAGPAEELARALEPDDALDRLTSLAAMLLHATPTEMGMLGAVEILPFVLLSLPVGVWLEHLEPDLTGDRVAAIGRHGPHRPGLSGEAALEIFHHERRGQRAFLSHDHPRNNEPQ